MLRTLCSGLIAALVASVAPLSQAQDFPNKPIRLIVPFATGGVTDNSARVLSDKLSKILGQQVIVENRPGASGNIGTAQVAQAAPDGYTLVLAFDGTMVINPHVFGKVPFDPVKDFAPITKLGDAAIVLTANPQVVPVKNFAELLAYGKANPGKLSFGHSGTGGTTHVAGELLKQRTGLDMTHIPYKSGGQAVADAVGGQVPLAYAAVAGAQAFIKSGRLTGIGVSSLKRVPGLDVPTFIEQGISGFEATSWVGVLAPVKTPRPVIEKLHNAITTALKDPDLRERYLTLGIDPVGNTPEQFSEQIKADLVRWGRVVEQAKIKLD
jgi:tripartite-type tricarboxylate transporter receptor subunit TctC